MIVLTNGRKLVTLHDARAVLLDLFGSVNARSRFLDHVIRLLLTAAETGKRADIAEATDQLVHLLRGRYLM